MDATTNGCDFPELHPIEPNPCLSTPHRSTCSVGARLWQCCGNRLPRGSRARVRLSNSGTLPSSNDPFFCRRQSHHMLLVIVKLKSVHFNFKYAVTNDRSLRSNTILVSGPYAPRFVSKDQNANARRQCPTDQSQNQKSKRRKRWIIEFSTTSGRVEDAGYRRRR